MSANTRVRIRRLAAIGLVLICAALFYVRFFLARPIGSGPAGPVVQREPFESVWSERKVMLIGIGDSVTAGLGAASQDHTYFNRLIRNPRDEYAAMQGLCLSQVLPNLESNNLAISGSTSDFHHRVIEEKLPQHGDDVFGVVVMTSGGNDLIHSYGRMPPKECAMYGATLEQAEPWIEAFRVRLNAMLDSIVERFPGGCEIYLANIYDPTDSIGDAPSIFLPPWPDGLAIHAKYNRVIEECAELREEVILVDLYHPFLGHGSHCTQFWRATYRAEDPTYWYHENVEDPNDRGYDAIRRIFLQTIADNTRLRPGR